jgi:hypothetical protein
MASGMGGVQIKTVQSDPSEIMGQHSKRCCFSRERFLGGLFARRAPVIPAQTPLSTRRIEVAARKTPVRAEALSSCDLTPSFAAPGVKGKVLPAASPGFRRVETDICFSGIPKILDQAVRNEESKREDCGFLTDDPMPPDEEAVEKEFAEMVVKTAARQRTMHVAGVFPSASRISVLSREEAQRRILERFSSLREEIAALKRVLASCPDDLTVKQKADLVRTHVGSMSVEKFGTHDANVVIGSGQRGEPGLFLGADFLRMRFNPSSVLSQNVARQLSVVQANESTGMKAHKHPDSYFEIFYPAGPEGISSWDDFCEKCGLASEGEEAKEKLYRLLHVMDNALLRERSEGVFVHCNLGQNRSACAVMAYLINRLGLTYEEALVFLMAKRPAVEPLEIASEIRAYAVELTA